MPFDSTFELDVLGGAARDAKYRDRVRRVIRAADPWTSAHTRSTWRVIDKLENGDVFTAEIAAKFLAGIEDDDDRAEVKLVVKAILSKPPAAAGYAAGLLEEWTRRAGLIAGTAKVVDKLAVGDTRGAEEVIRTLRLDPAALRNGVEGGDWFEGWEERQRARKEEVDNPDLRPVIRTRIAGLDHVLKGGIRVEELGLIVGFTNVGKSFFALNFAFTGAASGVPTLYISTEMSKALVDTRLDARFFKRESSDFYTAAFSKADLEEFEERRERARATLERRLFTYAVPVNSLTKGGIEDLLDDCEQKSGERVPFLVMDSADHMLPSTRIPEKRLQQSAVYWDLKAIVAERKVACWSTCHAPGSYKPLLTEFDQAESKEKGKIASTVLTLNQTPDEQRHDLLRIYVAKNRGGEKGSIHWIATDYARGSIEETEAPDGFEEDEDE